MQRPQRVATIHKKILDPLSAEIWKLPTRNNYNANACVVDTADF